MAKKRKKRKAHRTSSTSLAALAKTVHGHGKRLAGLEHFRARQVKLNGLVVRAIRGLRGGLAKRKRAA